MLELIIPRVELYDEENGFSYIRGQTLRLEHSLVSLAKWESKWNRPFISRNSMTNEETLHYIKCMTITQNPDPILLKQIQKYHLRTIYEYMEEPMTATTFKEDHSPYGTREVVTAEIIYYWMTAFNIPFSCEKWHLNRLLTLINVCNKKNQPKKKMSRGQILKQQHELNAARLKALGTTG